MNYIKMLLNIFSSGMDTVALYIFCNAVGGKKIFSKNKTILIYILVFIVSSTIVLNFSKSFILLGTMFTLCIGTLFIYSCSIFIKIFAGTILAILSVMTEIVTGIILAVLTKKSVEALSTSMAFYMQGVLISKTLMIIIVKVIQYKKIPKGFRVTTSLFFPMLALPASTLFITYLMSGYAYKLKDTKSVALVAAAAIMLIVANILVFYLFEKQLRQDEETQKDRLMHQQLQYQTEYYKELADKYKLSNKTVHDTKNQLFAISIALENNDMAKAKSKIDELCSNVSGGAKAFQTGNGALDALLNTKYSGIMEQNTTISYNIVIPPKNQIDDIDLCIIIGNALDNAIEACAKTGSAEPKIITLRMAQINDHLAIEMTNPAPDSISQSGGKLLSSKKDRELHGFGMQSIEEIVNKYNGNVDFSQKDGLFVLKIYMENTDYFDVNNDLSLAQ